MKIRKHTGIVPAHQRISPNGRARPTGSQSS